MARLESIAKGGYYPIPPAQTKAICNHLTSPNGGRILDPCAGKGVALRDFSSELFLEPYGAELNTNRANAARQLISDLVDSSHHNLLPHKDLGLTRLVSEDFQNIKAPKSSFQLLYLNPPYDHDDQDGRIEYTFLKRGSWWLQAGGVIVMVIPQHVVGHANVSKYLASWYENIRVVKFPYPDFETFKQIVVIATKKSKQTTATADILKSLIHVSQVDPLNIRDVDEPIADDEVFTIPSPKTKKITYSGLFFSEADAAKEYELYGNLTTQDYNNLFIPFSVIDKRPLMPFKMGHLAGLISAGLLNNIRLEKDDTAVLIKGRVRKDLIINSQELSDGEGTTRAITTKREIPITEITTLNASGDIESIPPADLPEFLDTWLPQLTEAVNRDYKPLYEFDLGIYKDLIGERGTLIPAQKHIVSAIATRLETNNEAIIVGEMGTGKTRIAAALVAATKHRRALILGPPHLVKKWIRETELVLPEANVIQIDNTTDVDKWMALDEKKQIQVAFLKFTSARMASGWEPAYRTFDLFTASEECQINEYRAQMNDHEVSLSLPVELRNKLHLFNPWRLQQESRGVRDSHMGCVLKDKKGFNVTSAEIAKGNKQFSRKSPGHKYELSKQKERHVPFFQYTRYTPDHKGFLQSSKKFTVFQNDLKRSDINLASPTFYNFQNPPSSKARWRVADYIKKKYKGRIGLMVVDEAHMTKGNDTDQGYAMARLAAASKQTVLMTGTIYGGKASTIFYLLYRTCSDIREAYTDKTATGRKRIQGKAWIDDYGMYEYRQTISSGSGANSGNKRVNETVKEAPGSSPAMLPWLLERTAFVSLVDMGLQLPDYEEIPISVEPTDDQLAWLEYLDKTLGQEMRKRLARGDRSLLGIYLQANLCWPDSPWRDEVIIDSKTKKDPEPEIICTIPALPEGIYPKEERIIELIKDNVFGEGRNVLLLCQQTRIRDITGQWEQKLRFAGLKPVTMRANASTRESWINKQVKNGANVLITHPKAVEVGLDLLDFPTIIWMGTEYSVYTILQASRRSYRIGQDRNIRVYFFYYAKTLQEKAVHLIAQKAAAAIRVNGDVISDTALAASDANSIEDALAKMILNNDEAQTHLVHDMFKEAHQTMKTTSSFIGGYEMSTPDDEPDSLVVTHSLPEGRPTSVIASNASAKIIEGEYVINEDEAAPSSIIDSNDDVQFVAVSMDKPTTKPSDSSQLRLVFGMSMAPSKTGRAKKRKKKVRASKQMSLFEAL